LHKSQFGKQKRAFQLKLCNVPTARIEYEDRIRQLEAYEPENANTPRRLFSEEYENLTSLALQVERQVVLNLRNRGVINDEVLRRIQRDIDLADVRLARRE
jgi:monovalent cation/hydrogen antiporter